MAGVGPVWVGGVCGALGIWGICWGWRNSKPLGGPALVCGTILWAYACFILLPWLASRSL